VWSRRDGLALDRSLSANAIRGVLDEAPSAYKNVDAVMRAQHDLVRIVHTLRQVVCIKG
jgi:tRNA-splicing ligase RtcB